MNLTSSHSRCLHNRASSRSILHQARSLGRGDLSRPGGVEKLLRNNRKWAQEKKEEDPTYFDRLCAQQAPEFFWIGCADSRVPANVIIGLEPGELFVQRNVGNQAFHQDMNGMSCLEYAVSELRVKAVILCGHYGCGAVKAALKLPSKTQGLVNCWINDIRECRNQNYNELKTLTADDQFVRLCELNVLRQTFHICTSPIVQNAWDKGQDVAIFGVIYDLKDGRLRKLVGPISRGNAAGMNFAEYEQSIKAQSDISGGSFGERKGPSLIPPTSTQSINLESMDSGSTDSNTLAIANKIARHVGWTSSGALPVPDSDDDYGFS